MTRDDIIRMARESADQSPRTDWNTTAWVFGEETLERFATLVYEHTWKEAGIAATKTVLDAAVLAEREACAKVCEETTAAWTQHLYNSGCMDCASAIRARGEK